MAIDKLNIIDAISTDRVTGATVLTVIDGCDWESTDVMDHLALLNEKLQNYVYFMESGQLENVRQSSVGTSKRIDMVFRCAPPEAVRSVLDRAAREIERIHGVPVTWRTDGGGRD